MEIITAPKAPAAVGPYSHAITHQGLAFCSGQIPLDPDTMEMVGTTIEPQTEQVMKNIKSVLEAVGTTLDRVVKTTVFLGSMDDFSAMNKVYEAAFGGHKPARSTFAVKALPKGALVEIECIAALE